jgi:hypothetical protein
MKEPFIVKVQVSLFSSDGIPSVLVYNKDRSIYSQFDATDDIVKAMKKTVGDTKKAFFWAKTDRNKKLNIYEAAPWQEW